MGVARFQQSFGYWCLHDTEWAWDLEQMCRTAKELGYRSIELVPADLWPTLRQFDLTCAIAFNGMPGAPFMRGLNNLRHQDEVITRTKEAIAQAADFGCPNVIAFTGYKWLDPEDPSSGEIPLEEGAKNTIDGLRELASFAEQRRVTVCLEQLNTRDDTHPMKGHPGYQGDDIDDCAEIVREVDSPRVKLLFDVYHVEIMNGDVIRRLGQYQDLIGHVHTAGNPGRNELDEDQEINYPAIVRALAETGYHGFVGHEFIPKRDPAQGLAQAYSLFAV